MMSAFMEFLKWTIRCVSPKAPEWWFAWLAAGTLIALMIALSVLVCPSGRSTSLSMTETRHIGWRRLVSCSQWIMALFLLPAVCLLVVSPGREVTLSLRHDSRQTQSQVAPKFWESQIDLTPEYERVLNRLRSRGAVGWFTPTTEFESAIAEECLRELNRYEVERTSSQTAQVDETRLPLWVRESVQITLVERSSRIHQRIKAIEADVARQLPNAGWSAVRAVYERRQIPVQLNESGGVESQCLAFPTATTAGPDPNGGGVTFRFTAIIRRDSSDVLNLVFSDSSGSAQSGTAADSRAVRLNLPPGTNRKIELVQLEASLSDWNPSYPVTICDPGTGVTRMIFDLSQSRPASSVPLIAPTSFGVNAAVIPQLTQILSAALQDPYFKDSLTRLGASPVSLTSSPSQFTVDPLAHRIYCTSNSIVVLPPGISYSEVPPESLGSTNASIATVVPTYAYRVNQDRERDADSFTMLAIPSVFRSQGVEEVATASEMAAVVVSADRLNSSIDDGRLYLPDGGQFGAIHPVASHMDIRGQRVSILRIPTELLFSSAGQAQFDTSLRRAVARWVVTAVNSEISGQSYGDGETTVDAVPRGRLVLDAVELSKLDSTSRRSSDLIGGLVIATFLVSTAISSTIWVRSRVLPVR